MARVTHQTMTRRVRVAEALLAFILIAGAALVGRLIVVGPLFADTVTISVDLPEAAGLHKNSDVTYRGQHVGSVTDVQLTATGVRATVRLDDGVQIPRDSDVVAANLSPVGEQYVDFRPRTASAPYLSDGDTIRLAESALPIPTWQVLAHSQHLLARIDTKDIETIARETNALFAGGDVDLPALITELNRTVGMVQRITPSVLALIRDAERPLRTLSDLAPDVRALVTNARSITKQLRASNSTIRQLIDDGATLIPVLAKEFDTTAPILARLLDDGTPVAAIANAHLPGLRHWYRWGPDQLKAMADTTRDGSGHVILVITGAKNCVYGPETSPYEENPPLPLTARCHTVDPHIQQRGSQHVPSPD